MFLRQKGGFEVLCFLLQRRGHGMEELSVCWRDDVFLGLFSGLVTWRASGGEG